MFNSTSSHPLLKADRASCRNVKAHLWMKRKLSLSELLTHSEPVRMLADDGEGQVKDSRGNQCRLCTMTAALHYGRKFQSLSGESFPEETVCPFCSQWRQPDNHHVRVRPKRKASRRVQQLLRREASLRHLNLKQTRVLRKFHGSRSMLMATCHTCHRKSKKSGALRNFLASFSKGKSTPEGTGKNSSASTTPRILSKSASELFKSSSKSTPFRTPRSASTESGISPKQGSATSSFSRLRKLLISGDTQTSKNGTLKDFLSSL